MNELRERNIKIAAELALATCNRAITVCHRDQLVLETELEEQTIQDVWARGFVARIPVSGRATALVLQVGQCGIELESRGRTATKDGNGADTQPVNAFRTLTDIRHTLYLGLENVPWSRPYCRDGGVARWHEGPAERRSARLNARVASAVTFSRKVLAPRRACRA